MNENDQCGVWVMRVRALIAVALVPSTQAFAVHVRASAAAPPALRVSQPCATLAPITLLAVTGQEAATADSPELLTQLQQFQDNHAFLIGIIVAIVTRLVINEVRYHTAGPNPAPCCPWPRQCNFHPHALSGHA